MPVPPQTRRGTVMFIRPGMVFSSYRRPRNKRKLRHPVVGVTWLDRVLRVRRFGESIFAEQAEPPTIARSPDRQIGQLSYPRCQGVSWMVVRKSDTNPGLAAMMEGVRRSAVSPWRSTTTPPASRTNSKPDAMSQGDKA